MIQISLAAAAVGVLASWIAMLRLARRPLPPGPTAMWIVGLVGPLPAWLVAFVGLLGPEPTIAPEPVRAAAFVLSSAGGLLGAIATDALVRRLRPAQPERSPVVYWLLGLAATTPAWLIALTGLIRASP